jgi:hypothetical protein
MWRTDVGGGKQVPLSIEPETGKVLEDVSKAVLDEPWDVLKEHEAGLDVADEAGDVRPEPPVILDAELLPGDTEGLTWEARTDEIHCATPLRAWEGDKVVPDRSLIQALFCHPRHESRRRVGFPFNETNSADASNSELEPERDPADPRAEGEFSNDSRGT